PALTAAERSSNLPRSLQATTRLVPDDLRPHLLSPRTEFLASSPQPSVSSRFATSLLWGRRPLAVSNSSRKRVSTIRPRPWQKVPRSRIPTSLSTSRLHLSAQLRIFLRYRSR